MSQTKFWSVSAGQPNRKATDGSPTEGSGNSKRLYVGRKSGYDYKSHLKFTLDWSGVGQIVTATLIVYTDDFLGEFGQPSASDTPKVTVRRLVASWSEGNAADGVWQANDYVAPSATTQDQRTATMTKTADGLNRIDITAMVEDWAPATVKRRDGTQGGKATHHGIVLRTTTDVDLRWSGWSEDATDPLLRPQIELVYELGATTPDTPTNLSPSGAVASIGAFQADFSDPRPTDTLAKTEVEVYTDAATNSGQVISGGTLLWTRKVNASNTEVINARSNLIPSDLDLATGTTYKWRVRQYDQESKASLWADLVSFSITNTNPVAPTQEPADASSYDSLNGVLFRGGTFSDADGDTLLAYQVQLSAYASGSPNWDDPVFLLWDTGKVYVASDSTEWETPYGGKSLDAGTYYWRARHWDSRDGVSAWSYASIILTTDFDQDPGSQSSVQIDPHAPWRIVIRDMGASRGPGDVVAILENAKATGASIMYNSPGELHFTLPVDHPQISVIEPKQTHYAVEFYSGDGWRETFAGLVWDYDATETGVIFLGIDYLALFDLNVDERWDSSNPDKSSANGGSKYVNQTIHDIVESQLNYNIGLTDSPTGFITVGSLATMNEKVTIWSTFQPTLAFVAGLLDSHRQGTGKKTRVSVFKDTGGVYTVKVDDDPGVTRDNLRLKYGELVQGYRVIPFGTNWASRVPAIGRTRDGLKVLYKAESAPGIDQAVWGRISAQPRIFDGVSDENDMIRRTKQAALNAGKLGKQLALAVRSGVLNPLDGYDVCDAFPVDITHGAVNTSAFGSGYWIAYGVAWEVGDEEQGSAPSVVLTFLPREDTTAPDTDLIPTVPISPQPEWQIGWVPPDPLAGASSKYYYDIATGLTYVRQDDGTYILLANDPRNNNQLVNSGFEMNPIPTLLSKVWTAAADWATATSTVNLDTSGTELGMTDATY